MGPLMNASSVKIILAEDHLVFREMIKKSIQKIPDLEVIGEAGNGLELLELLKTTSPDMIILDIAVPELQGIESAQEIKKLYPEIKILMITMHKSSEHIYRAISAGVDAYLLKENAYADLISAIKTIREGKKYFSSLISDQVADIILGQPGEKESDHLQPLSRRELEILKYVAQGKTSKEIGELLLISDLTVHNHRVNIKKKLKIKRTADLIKYAVQHGYI